MAKKVRLTLHVVAKSAETLAVTEWQMTGKQQVSDHASSKNIRRVRTVSSHQATLFRCFVASRIPSSVGDFAASLCSFADTEVSNLDPPVRTGLLDQDVLEAGNVSLAV